MIHSQISGFVPPASKAPHAGPKVNPHDLFYTSPPAKRDPIMTEDGKLIYDEMTIGDRIRWMRTQKGEQQTDLSLKTGLSQAAISNFENNLLTPGNKEGKQSLRQPRGVTLTKVAMELGTTPEWLMTGVGDPKYKLQTKSTEEEKILAMLGKATPEQRKAIVAMIEMVLK